MLLNPMLFHISMQGSIEIQKDCWSCCIEVLTKPPYVLSQKEIMSNLSNFKLALK